MYDSVSAISFVNFSRSFSTSIVAPKFNATVTNSVTTCQPSGTSVTNATDEHRANFFTISIFDSKTTRTSASAITAHSSNVTGSTPSVLRIWRTNVTKRTSLENATKSRSAEPSYDTTNDGHSAIISDPPKPAVFQICSVTNGINGCHNARIVLSTCARIASFPFSIFAISKYQSAKSFHVKSRNSSPAEESS